MLLVKEYWDNTTKIRIYNDKCAEKEQEEELKMILIDFIKTKVINMSK